MKMTHLLRILCASIVLAASSSAISASTVLYEWSLQHKGHTVTGYLEGLVDNAKKQSVTGFAITSSTLGGVGRYDVADARRNKNFKVKNENLRTGVLVFRGLGDKTIASPLINFVLRVKKGEVKKLVFVAHNGERGGRVKLNANGAGAESSIQAVPAVPTPAGLPLLLAGLGGFGLLRARKMRS